MTKHERKRISSGQLSVYHFSFWKPSMDLIKHTDKVVACINSCQNITQLLTMEKFVLDLQSGAYREKIPFALSTAVEEIYLAKGKKLSVDEKVEAPY